MRVAPGSLRSGPAAWRRQTAQSCRNVRAGWAVTAPAWVACVSERPSVEGRASCSAFFILSVEARGKAGARAAHGHGEAMALGTCHLRSGVVQRPRLQAGPQLLPFPAQSCPAQGGAGAGGLLLPGRVPGSVPPTPPALCGAGWAGRTEQDHTTRENQRLACLGGAGRERGRGEGDAG